MSAVQKALNLLIFTIFTPNFTPKADKLSRGTAKNQQVEKVPLRACPPLA